MIVYLLQHEREDEAGYENVKVIGIYSTEELANDAIKALSILPGFRDYPDGFSIDPYTVDKSHWLEGFGFES